MQRKDEKTLQLRYIIGEKVKELREKKEISCNQFEQEYDFSKGSVNRIENAKFDCKVISLWKIAEAFGMKPSELVALIEEQVDFKLIDE